jgi:transposase
MPNNNFISNIMEMEDLNVTNVESDNEEMHISFELKRKDHVCPGCGALTNKVHDYRTSVIKDAPILGKKTFLHYRKRRYHCDCCGRHFNETFNYLPKHCRIMTRLNFFAINLLADVQNVSSVARQVGISPSSIFRRMNDINFPKPASLPQVLSIDEFKGNAGGEKFQAILTDAKNHAVFDILPSRSQYKLTDYLRDFKNRNDVRYFVMDMNRVYREIAEVYFPNATIVIDKFHVVRQVTWAMENVRKRIQKNMHPSKRKYYKRSRRIMLSHYWKLNDESRQALEVMVSQSSDLAAAYYLKEQFYVFMNSKSKAEAEKKLRKFILSAQASGLKEFDACLTMLSNWSKYILNAFECPYTNGYTEGTNNKIKVIKRNAYGFRNFKNFRNRILLASRKA